MTYHRFESTSPGRTRVSIAALFLLPTFACGKIGFDIEHQIPEQEVVGSPLGQVGQSLPISFAFPLSIDLESQTMAQGTGPAHSASLKSLELSVTGPQGETFEFLDSITISVAADGEETKTVARLNDVPPQPRISLEVVPDVDLLPYIRKRATMSASATGHQPRQTVRFQGTVVVRIRI